MDHANSSVKRRTAILLLYAATALFVMHVFMCKNGWFRELTDTGFSFDRMVSYTADRPFAYRMLMPALINAGASAVPDAFAHAHRRFFLETSPLVPYARNELFKQEALALKVHLAYIYLYASLLFLLYAARSLARSTYPELPPALRDCAPAAAALLLPLTFTWGGHIYDFPELLLSCLCLICIVKKKWSAYYPLFALAVLNKETGILLIAFFIAFCQGRMPGKKLLAHAAAQAALGACLIIWIRLLFAGNPAFPGLDAYWRQNLRFWLDPASYFLFWDAYFTGMPVFPRGSNILLLSGIGFLCFYKWGQKPAAVRRLLAYSALPTIPLFLYRGCADEIRALSPMFPAVFLLGVHTASLLVAGGRKGKEPAFN